VWMLEAEQRRDPAARVLADVARPEIERDDQRRQVIRPDVGLGLVTRDHDVGLAVGVAAIPANNAKVPGELGCDHALHIARPAAARGAHHRYAAAPVLLIINGAAVDQQRGHGRSALARKRKTVYDRTVLVRWI